MLTIIIMMSPKAYLKLSSLSFCVVFVIFFFEIRTFLVYVLPINILTSCYIIVFLLLSMAIFFTKKTFNRTSMFEKTVLILLFLYGIRIFYDIFLIEIEQSLFINRYTFIVYYIFLILIPYITCINISLKGISFKALMCLTLLCFVVALVLSFRDILLMISLGDIVERYNANNALDTIGYGHLALSTLLISYVLLKSVLTPKEKHRVSKIVVLLLIIVFSMTSMILANSRGPFLAFFIIVILCLANRFSLKNVIFITLLFSFILYHIESISEYFNIVFGSSFLERIILAYKEGDSSGREILFNQAMEAFLESPIWGSSLLMQKPPFLGNYPHNFFFEVLMSLGILGGCFYVCSIVLAFKYSFFLLREDSKYTIFALLFFQYFVYSMFSRSMLTMPMYWMILGLLSLAYNYERKLLYEISSLK